MRRFKTPISRAAILKFRSMSPRQAAIKAWSDPGNNPEYHRQAQMIVRDAMPLLAMSLDRLTIQDRKRKNSRRRLP